MTAASNAIGSTVSHTVNRGGMTMDAYDRAFAHLKKKRLEKLGVTAEIIVRSKNEKALATAATVTRAGETNLSTSSFSIVPQKINLTRGENKP